MNRICLLVSGNLGYVVLLDLFQSKINIASVFTNKKSVDIIAFCNANNIPFFTGNPRNGKASEFLESQTSDILLSVNYLFIIDNHMINHPKFFAVNFHGSLLPKYRGRTPHVWAIINNEKYTGVTAHLINEKVDDGDIIDQLKIEIDYNDTGGSILEKFFRLYPEFIKSVLTKLVTNNYQLKRQKASLATYFGKRSPDDGLINWNWQRDRIRNWIRAQAKPYPGAFTFFEGRKITIHKAEMSEDGFHFNDLNGLIVNYENQKITVKTPNGCLLLSEIEIEDNIEIKRGKCLYND